MTQKKQKTKNQHYVPQSYLRRFSPDGTHIFVFDKVSRRSFPAAIRNIAQEHCFYDVSPTEDNGLPSEQAVEEYFASVEGQAKAAIDNLLEIYETEGIPPPLRVQMALFLVIQVTRTRQARNSLKWGVRKLHETLVKCALDNGQHDFARVLNLVFERDQRSEALHHATNMLDPSNLLAHMDDLLGYIWTLGVNQSSVPLLTSDTPVVAPANLTQRFYPLTPRHLLMLSQPQYFPHVRHKDGKAVALTDQNVVHYNAFQVMMSNRQVFSSSHDFSLAEQICKDRPDICVPRA